MKNFQFLLMVLCGLALGTSCSKTGVKMDPAALRTKADSIVNVRTAVLTDSIGKACEAKKAVEVQKIVDSTMLANKAAAEAAKAAAKGGKK